MQLTIDSTEPLDRVLKMVSSLYGVELAVVGTAGQQTSQGTSAATSRRAQTAPGGRGRRTGKTAAARPAARKSVSGNGGPRRASAADLSEIRNWAREKGFQVSDRGRVSNAVLKAYEEERRSAS